MTGEGGITKGRAESRTCATRLLETTRCTVALDMTFPNVRPASIPDERYTSVEISNGLPRPLVRAM